MRAVGIRELKNKLSEYLREVKAGEEILVTDRGRVVAELRAPSSPETDLEYPGLHRMARHGRVRLGAANDPDAYPRMPRAMPKATVAELLDAARGER